MAKPRPIPSDFAEVAPTMTRTALVDRYKTSDKAVRRWLRETGVEAKVAEYVTKKPRDMPEDFAENARQMSYAGLRNHYKAGDGAIRRWLKESGVKLRAYVKHVPGSGIKNAYGNLAFTSTRSIWDEAADVIRRERFPVNRCDAQGNYAQAGDWWRVGLSVLTPDELLERADRYRRRAA